MKRRVFVLLACVFMVAAISAPAAKPRPVYTEFTAIEVFDPFDMLPLNGPVGYYQSLGTVNCPGGEPTGDPMQPCPVGSGTITRNTVWVSRMTSTTPEAQGWATIKANANFDADFCGRMWGTFTLVLDNGLGTWEGTWTSERELMGPGVWHGELRAKADGIEGSVLKQRMKVASRISSWTGMPVCYTADIRGRIIDRSNN